MPLVNGFANIPAMTDRRIHEYLMKVGESWTGQGVAVECGCWLGASTAALGVGLWNAHYDRPMHCFDLWRATKEEVVKAKAQGVSLLYRQDTLPLFKENVSKLFERLMCHRINLWWAEWDDTPIEIWILDACKRDPAFSIVVSRFSHAWIPGVTIVGLLDYYTFRKKPPEHRENYRAQERFVEQHEDSFELMHAFDGANSAAFFRFIKPFEPVSATGRYRRPCAI